MFVCFCVTNPSPVIKVYRYYVAFQKMTNNLKQSPSCFVAKKLSPDGESETRFDLKTKIWIHLGKQNGRPLGELLCELNCDSLNQP